MTKTPRKPAPKAPRPDEPARPGTPRANGKRHVDELLDAALEETFPASDPVAVTDDA